MPSSISQILEKFDEKFRPIDFCNEGKNKMIYVEQTRDEIKNFIRQEITGMIKGLWMEVDKTITERLRQIPNISLKDRLNNFDELVKMRTELSSSLEKLKE